MFVYRVAPERILCDTTYIEIFSVTFRVQQLGQAQVLFSQVEGILQVVVSVGLLQLVKVDQIRPERDKRTRWSEVSVS